MAQDQPVVIYSKQPIGAGSFGEVYKANYCGSIFAAKKLHQRYFQNEAMVTKFLEECKLLWQLSHINIVRYIDIISDPDTKLPVLLMELMTKSLTRHLQDCKEPIAYRFQVNMCCDIASALSYLHSCRIMHRDLSSNNVLVNGEHVKIGDFGMAKLLETLGPHTRCPGTEAYMPPEALNQLALYTTSIDCYSFGILAIQIVTREIPSTDKTNVDSIELQVLVTIPKNFIRKCDLQNPLIAIACQCLTKSDIRPQSHKIHGAVKGLKQTLAYSLSGDLIRQKESGFQLQEKITAMENYFKELKKQHQEELLAKKQEIARLTQDNLHLQRDLEYRSQPQSSAVTIRNSKQHVTTSPRQLPTKNASSHNPTPVRKLRWDQHKQRSPEISRSTNAVSNSTTIYFRASLSLAIHAYDITSEQWSNCLYVYNEVEKKWEQNSALEIARRLCFAISLPNNTLLVVGGHTTPTGTSIKTHIMEIGK